MSSLVTEPLQVHSLPRKPSWLTVNDERRTMFVVGRIKLALKNPNF